MGESARGRLNWYGIGRSSALIFLFTPAVNPLDISTLSGEYGSVNSEAEPMQQIAAIDPDRLSRVIHLSRGWHMSAEDGLCVMEAVAFVAGEPFSDHPVCASHVISCFVRDWNDALPDDERDRLLLPLVPRLIGTRGSHSLEDRRALMAGDWLLRVCVPAWLRLAGLNGRGDAFAELPEITCMEQVLSLSTQIEAARDDAVAAEAASRHAAQRAARYAARDAAGPAAAAAASWAHPWSGEWEVAWEAAGAAVEAAAAAAGSDVLGPVRASLQQSALSLVMRMVEASDE